jgi:hypothetical protein
VDEPVVAPAVRPDHEEVIGPGLLIVAEGHGRGVRSGVVVLADNLIRVGPQDGPKGKQLLDAAYLVGVADEEIAVLAR